MAKTPQRLLVLLRGKRGARVYAIVIGSAFLSAVIAGSVLQWIF